MTTTTTSSWARAAAAATALLLARLGDDVVLVDREAFPADTMSTHQPARPGVLQLDRRAAPGERSLT